jgi:hypothetical protein
LAVDDSATTAGRRRRANLASSVFDEPAECA